MKEPQTLPGSGSACDRPLGRVTVGSLLVWLMLTGRGLKARSLCHEGQLPLPVEPKELGDASALHGTGEMEAAVAARLVAGDGGPALATDEAVLQRAEQPPSAAASGPPQPAPHLRAGRRMWPLLGHTVQIRLAEEAPVLEPLWSCWEQDFCLQSWLEGLAFLSWGLGQGPANLSWHKSPCSWRVLTFCAARTIVRRISSGRNPRSPTPLSPF